MTSTVTIQSAYDCGKRVPPSIKDPVPGAPLRLLDGTQGGQAVHDEAQTTALSQANDEKGTVLWIYDQCEAEKQAALDKATAPWWAFWR